MCVVTSVIMLIIGSNIARAFSLVGALSIIRFRSAVKDPRDVGFIFFAMAVGMAVGTRFYLIGIVLTFLLCGISFALTKFNIGAKPFSETLLKVLVGEDLDYEASFEPAFYTHLQSYALLSVDAADDESIEVTYSVKFKSGAAEKQLLDSMEKIPGTQRVSLLHGLQNINV